MDIALDTASWSIRGRLLLAGRHRGSTGHILLINRAAAGTQSVVDLKMLHALGRYLRVLPQG